MNKIHGFKTSKQIARSIKEINAASKYSNRYLKEKLYMHMVWDIACLTEIKIFKSAVF